MTSEQKQEVHSLLLSLNTLVQGYEGGDLLKAVDIKDCLTQLYRRLQSFPGEEKLARLTQYMLQAARGLRDPEKEPTTMSFLRSIGEDMSAFMEGRLGAKEFSARVRSQASLLRELLSLEPPSTPPTRKEPILPDHKGPEPGTPSEGETIPPSNGSRTVPREYPVGYFESIVEDEKLLSQFYSEAKEHLDEAQSTLVELEYDPTNKELINTLFRNFHTIKGSSAFLGLRNVEELSHAIEDLLALVRESKLFLSKELIDFVFHGMEILRNILDGMQINEFRVEEMKKSFRIMEIFPFIDLMRKFLEQHKHKKLGEILAEEGKISLKDLHAILHKQEQTEKKIGELIVEEKIATTEDVLEALKKQKAQSSKVKRLGFVKVSNEKLNTLIDIVGELVINQSMLKQELTAGTRGDGTERNISQLENITTTIKNLVLSMGMTPISEIFTKLRVVARNTAEELGKSVFVEMRGEETELDRNVIETIYDPLIHIIRNSIDHGIEPAEIREQQGKDRVGRILLAAEHKGSGIEIVIQDDGQGIDLEKVKAKAVEQGLVDREDAEALSAKEIYNFLFLPGFSTSKSVTTLSGRGVGLDVVKKNLDSIHGRVEITSEPGKFTRIVIRLPLTLAIIEGFVTRVGEGKYVFPFSAIEEIKVIEPSEVLQSENGSEALIYHRGSHIPVIKAHRVFKEKQRNTGNGARQGNSGERLLSLLFALDQSKYCVVVDELIGKQEIVIKNLSDTLLQECTYFSGGTIFGDGSIGFVVDMQGFLEALA